MKRLIFFFLITGVLFAQAKFPSMVATGVDLPTLVNNVGTILTQPVNKLDTVIYVASTSGFTLPGPTSSLVIVIDSEYIHICHSTPTTFTVCANGRSYDSIANNTYSHLNSRPVKEAIVAHHINQLSLEVMAVESSLGTNLSNVALANHTHAVGGDLNGSVLSARVVGLQGRLLSSQTPHNGDVWSYDVSSDTWKPVSIGGSTGIVNAPSVWPVFATVATSGLYNDLAGKPTIPAAQVQSDWTAQSGIGVILHKPSIFDGDYNHLTNQPIIPAAQVQSDWTAQSGLGVILHQPVIPSDTSQLTNGANFITAAGAPVLSFGTRTGAVTPASGDYTAAMVTNAVSTLGSYSDPAWLGITWGGGRLTGIPTAFNADRINGVTLSTIGSGPLKLTGGVPGLVTYSDIIGLFGSCSGTMYPGADGQCHTASSGGSGVSMAYELGDLTVVRSTSKILTIGTNCTTGTPCHVRIGSQTFQISNYATVTISGTGTGTAFIYISSAGILTVGHNLTIGCSAGCVQTPAITQYPAGSFPIMTWTASSGNWDPTGTDQRSVYSVGPSLVSGSGITLTSTLSQTTISPDLAVLEQVANKGAANGYAPLGSDGKVPSANLPTSGGGTTYTFGANLTTTGTAVDFNPVDSSILNLVDDFFPGKVSGNLFTQLGWGVSVLNSSCGENFTNGVVNHPGILMLNASPSAGTGCLMSLADTQDGGNNKPLATLGTGGSWSSWDMQAIVHTDPDSVASVRYLVGFGDNDTAYHPAGGNEIAVRYDPAGGGCSSNESTANWVYEVVVSGTKTCVNSSVSVVANTWYHMDISSTTAGTINFKINGASAGTIATAPAAGVQPQLLVMSTGGGSNEFLWIDWWAMQMKGLVR